MADWMLYTILGAAALLVILLAALIIRGKLVLGEIEIGWPPKITLRPKGGGPSAGSKDEVVAKNDGKIGAVSIEGAAENFSATADGGEIGDVTVKRKL